MAGKSQRLEALEKELHAMANAQVDMPEYRRLYAVPLNREAAQIYILQRAHFVLNRRACWAHVQGSAPFDVKRLIWEHEQEELAGDPDRGVDDHFMLGVKEGASVGLKPGDFEAATPLSGVEVAFCAWLHIARDRPWLEALAASCILEIANSDAIVKGGGNSRRIGDKMRDELGIPFDQQHSNAEHVVAEIEHANMLMRAADTHGTTSEARQQILRGARLSLAVDRAYKGALGEAMAATSGALAA